MEFKQKLKGKVALVAGATRGAGRGIACMLGEAGATVYCTGRSVRGQPSDKNRPESIEETAEMVTARGGVGRFIQVNHTDQAQVKNLFERVKQEQDGRLDILVNDLTGDSNMEFKPFLEHSLEKGLKLLENGSLSHLITSYFGRGGMYAVLPIVTAFLFSFIHGSFTGDFWTVLGVEAKKKKEVK